MSDTACKCANDATPPEVDWREEVRKAQLLDTVTIDGADYSRLAWGSDTFWLPHEEHPADRGQPCRTCLAEPGELHLPKCEDEQCPRCAGQAIQCNCPAHTRLFHRGDGAMPICTTLLNVVSQEGQPHLSLFVRDDKLRAQVRDHRGVLRFDGPLPPEQFAMPLPWENAAKQPNEADPAETVLGAEGTLDALRHFTEHLGDLASAHEHVLAGAQELIQAVAKQGNPETITDEDETSIQPTPRKEVSYETSV